MKDGEEWLMRPVSRQMCKYESLLDGTVDMEAIARMNAALDVEAENEARIREADE
jgi:hypothetical protein